MKPTDLVTEAYGVRYEQVVGALNWGNGTGAALYDMEAKVEDDARPTREQVQQMLQALLEDRFQTQSKARKPKKRPSICSCSPRAA